jgi:lipopolysaccharide/colanic/teichoic acid biosynthesis glycosyltransferase
VKRVFDVCAALLLLAISAPVWVPAACAIAVVDGRPVLFRQARVGQYGRTFVILKFRTMRAAPGRALTVGGDSRITRLGFVLRAVKVDEIPQFVNVVCGDMSLVGWRPELPAIVAAVPDLYAPLLKFKPGIIDPATVRFRHESRLLAVADDPERFYLDEVLPEKVGLSLAYARRASFLSDLRLLARLVA